MIDFCTLHGFPHERDGQLALRLHGTIIGTVAVWKCGRLASCFVGLGLDSEGIGEVSDRDRYGRPVDIHKAAASWILEQGGYPDRII